MLSESQDSSDADAWIISSTKRYQQISMYEVDKPSKAIDWFGTRNDYICMASSEPSNSYNEMVVCQLPPEHLHSSQTDPIYDDRDLSVVAGCSCERPSDSLWVAPSSFSNASIVARTQLGSSNIYMHNLPNILTDRNIENIHQGFVYSFFQQFACPPAVLLHGNASLTCGIKADDIRLVDCCRDSECAKHASCNEDDLRVDRICNIFYPYSEHVCVFCLSPSGSVYSVDWREKESRHQLKGRTWDSRGSCSMVVSDGAIVLVNEVGEVCAFDVRKPNETLLNLTLECPPWTGSRAITHHTVKSKGNYLSVSGADNCVRIYDIEKLRVRSGCTLSPVFVHDGHLADVDNEMPIVWNHVWSQTTECTLLSSSSTGQIHTWTFKPSLDDG